MPTKNHYPLKERISNILANHHTTFEICIEVTLILLSYLLKTIIDKKWGWIIIVLWSLVMISLIFILIIIKKFIRDEQAIRSIKYRVCLLNMRTLFVSLAQQIYDASEHNFFYKEKLFCTNIKCNSPDIKSRCFKQRVLKRLKHKVVEMIYHQLSTGNQDLSKIYRVALFEPFNNDHLKVVAFANYEKLRPKYRSLDLGFKKKEGAVGWCWFYGNPLSIQNVPEDIKSKNGLFKLLDNNEKSSIGSIVCYPVINRLRNKEEIEAILCIDCDQTGLFDISIPERAKSLRIEIFPYLRFLSLLYSSANYGLKSDFINKCTYNITESSLDHTTEIAT